jgi:hypothetical protein
LKIIILKGGSIMKKFISFLLILICLSFNIIIVTPALAANVFTEGVYKLSDLNFSSNNLYTIQNISSNNGVYVAIFDAKNTITTQSVKLGPKSLKYKLLPLHPTDRIMIIGDGDVYISPRTSG